MKEIITKELADFIRQNVTSDKEIDFNPIRHNKIFCTIIKNDKINNCFSKCENCHEILHQSNHECNLFKRELLKLIEKYNPLLLDKISIEKSYRFTTGDPGKIIDLVIQEKNIQKKFNL